MSRIRGWKRLAATLAGVASMQAAAVCAAERLGHIEFPTSGSPAAQERFIEGVLLLHSFEYDDAREQFREARDLDPGFAMAYWGEAMTHNHPIWLRQDRDAALRVLGQLGVTPEARAARAPTPRERDWLATLDVLYGEGEKLARDRAYAEAMRRLTERYPKDLEAAAFYALSLLGTCHDGRDFATYMRAASVVEEVFGANPRHPGAVHYLIHSYDEAIHAPLGLRAARVYAEVAPAAAHAQHMPSHIFLALGMWDASVEANERSWSASEERIRLKSLPKTERGYHALEWLAYSRLQKGNYDKAAELLEIVRKDAGETGHKRMRGFLAGMRATYTVESRRWDEAPAGVDTEDLGVVTAVADLVARGFSALRTGRPAEARSILGQLEVARRTRVAAAEAGCHAPGTESRDNLPALQTAEVMELELRALIDLEQGRAAEGLETLRRAAALDDRIASEFGPPGTVKPPHELLGEILLERGDARGALEQFDGALARAPGRSLALLGRLRAASAAGQDDVARDAYARLRANWAEADGGAPSFETLVARGGTDAADQSSDLQSQGGQPRSNTTRQPPSASRRQVD